jgi:hypothetical protein
MDNEKHLKNIIASHQNQPIDFDVDEVDAFLSKRLNKHKRKVTKNAIVVFSFLLLGAGLYLIKYKKPVTHKPVVSEAIILKEKEDLKPKQEPTLVRKLVTKKQKSIYKRNSSKAKKLDDKQDLVDVNNNLAINEVNIDYSVYNNISEINNINEYNNINFIANAKIHKF